MPSLPVKNLDLCRAGQWHGFEGRHEVWDAAAPGQEISVQVLHAELQVSPIDDENVGRPPEMLRRWSDGADDADRIIDLCAFAPAATIVTCQSQREACLAGFHGTRRAPKMSASDFVRKRALCRRGA